jgi:aspartokinase-like uncharacterized kinase
MTAERTVVVKLGGSLWAAPELRAWLGLLAAPAPLVPLIVPGGGPFADAVRAAQPRMGFDATAAHRMAILAMAQYGEALAALEPRLARVRGQGPAIAAAGPAVWCPWPEAAEAAELARSWDVTSDSIAAWLAARLGAGALLLVKSVPEPAGDAAGLLDAAFAGHARAFAGTVQVTGRAAAATLPDLAAILAAAPHVPR